MSTLDLRALVREQLAGSEADPGVIAGRVIAAIPKSQYGAALTQVMRLFVRQVISETRTTGRTGNVTPIRSTPSTSWKGNAIRDGWQRHLDNRLHVGESEWKLLRNCTHADLLAVAAERQQKAEQNSAWARTYRAYAAAVDAAGVATFGDLPAVEQMNLLGGAA